MAEKKKKVEIFDTEEKLAVSLARYTADLFGESNKAKVAFIFVLSGGYLIHNLSKLKEPPYVGSVDWSKWHVFWLDERVVPKTHPDSNYKARLGWFPVLGANSGRERVLNQPIPGSLMPF